MVLTLEDNFTSQMARAAAAAALMSKTLGDVDRSSVRAGRSMGSLGKSGGSISQTSAVSTQASREIDRLSGRMRVLTDVAAILGPSLVPIGAVAIPAVTGLAAQLGAVAVAGGTAVVAFQGVGTALEAVNKAALEPSAANLEAARIAMQRISPEARRFVTELREMMPAFQAVRNAAAAGLFPGLTAALGELEGVLPRVEKIFYNVGAAMGDMAESAAESLAGPRWADFIDFIGLEAPRALGDLGRIMGNVAHGLAELWMAFDPLNDNFSSWLLDVSSSFDRWAAGLSQTEGFRDFVEYVQTNGPRVADAVGAIAEMVFRLVEAAAPLGGPVLGAIEAVADALAAIAGSDAGPAIMGTVTAMALLSRGTKAFESVSRTAWATAVRDADTFGQKMAAARSPILRVSGALTGLAVASTGLADGIGLSNTASMALMGTLGGPWGAAVGGAVGLMVDLSGSQREAAVDAETLTSSLNQQTGAITQNTRAYVAKQFADKGVLDAAQAMGLGLQDVTDAALGNEAALARVSDGIESAKGELFDSDGRLVASRDKWMSFRENMELVNAEIGDTSGKLSDSQGRLGQVAEATGRAADGFEQAASAAETFRAAVEKLNRQLEGRASMRDYEAALDDFTESVKANGRSLDTNTEKGRANEAALDAIASNALRVAETLKGSNRIEFLKQARRDLMAAAGELEGGERNVQRLIDKLREASQTPVKPKIDVDTSGVMASINAVESWLNGIADEDVYINVRRRSAENSPGGLGPQPAGGSYATGGWTGPGSKYQPAGVVHADEFVFSKEATSGNVAFLSSLHQQLRGYANGGMVTRREVARTVPASSSPAFSFPSQLRITGVLQTPDGRSVPVDGVADFHDMSGAKVRTNYRGV